MKIPLTYADGRIFINAVITCISAHIGYTPIYFIIDTGSPISFISEEEAKRANFPLNKFTFETHTRMAGGKHELKILKKPVSLYLKNEKGNSSILKLSSLKISQSTSKAVKEKEVASQFPSIIGTDFLEENNLILYCDLKNNNCYLELKEK